MNNINQNLDIKTSLQTTVFITPQMKQSLAILQMPILELEQEISAILEENPVLEVAEDGGDEFNDIEDYDDIDNYESNTQDDEVIEKTSDDDNLNNLVEKVTGDDWDEYIGYEKLDDNDFRQIINDNIINLKRKQINQR